LRRRRRQRQVERVYRLGARVVFERWTNWIAITGSAPTLTGGSKSSPRLILRF